MALAVPRSRIAGWTIVFAMTAATVAYGLMGEKLPVAAPLVVLGMGGATLAFAGLALWRTIDPLLRDAAPPTASVAAGAAPATSIRLRELEREKQAVLKAIKEIELDYQMRKVAPADYKEMIERYRGRAMRLIAEVDAGDDFRGLIERELKLRMEAAEAAGTAGAAGVAGETTAGAVSVPTPAAGATTCARCATRNDDDAEFCKRCGQHLRS